MSSAKSGVLERGRQELAGIELADSVALDPHKWLYQPIECGSLLVREGHLLREAFAINPDYLADYKRDEVSFSDLGVQLTRGARVLKIWLSINYVGLDAFGRAIDRTIDLAHAAVYDPNASFPGELLCAMDEQVRPFAQPSRLVGRPYDFQWHGLMGYNDSGSRVVGAHPRHLNPS